MLTKCESSQNGISYFMSFNFCLLKVNKREEIYLVGEKSFKSLTRYVA